MIGLFLTIILSCLWTNTNAGISHEEIATLRDYQTMDGILLDYLKTVIAILEAKLDYIHALRKNFVGESALKLDPYRYVSDVIQNFKIAKRFTYKWQDIYGVLNDNPNEMVDERFRRRLSMYPFPTMSEFRDVAMSYLNTQRKRHISAKDLADGTFLGAKYKTPLRGSDCYALASFLIYDPEKRVIALEWLREAYARFDKGIEWLEYQRKLILDFAYTLTKTGHIQEAANLTQTMAETAESHDFTFVDVHLYFKALNENRSMPDIGENISPTVTSLEWSVYPPLRATYLSKVCSGSYALQPSYVSRLKCRYTTRGSPLFILTPLKEENVYLEPKVSIYRQFLTDSEIDRIINQASGQMHDSGIRVSPSQTGHQTSQRSSKSYFAPNHLPAFEGFLKRTDALVGLTNETAEPLQVTYYDAGGYYTTHYDSFPYHFELPNGNRITTVLFYLNDNLVGGETAFYNLNALVGPERGSALVWDNLKKNGQTNMFSGHGACPVLYGHKWIATRWFHSKGQMFHRPCTLNQND